MNIYGGRGTVMADSKDNNLKIPKHEIESLARCLLPEIQKYFETEKGKREFEEWKEKHKHDKEYNN